METTIPTTTKKSLFNFNKKQIVIAALSILGFFVLLFIILYRGAKRRADELEEKNNDLKAQFGGEETIDTPHVEVSSSRQNKDISKEVENSLNQIRAYNNDLEKQRDTWMSTAIFLSKLQNSNQNVEPDTEEAEEVVEPELSKVVKMRAQRIKQADFSKEQYHWKLAKEQGTLEAIEDFLEMEFNTARYKGVATRMYNKLKAEQNETS